LPTIREAWNKTKDIFKEAVVEIIKQEEDTIDFQERIGRLPYIFKDPIKFDKKVDPKKLRFGSKISAGVDSQREKYYSVKEIISPEVMVLNNGLKVRLLGVKEKPDKNGAAVQFLKEKTRGQKVFMKFDTVK
jgi:site-specific DNA-methyltransferase (adenine-specific)